MQTGPLFLRFSGSSGVLKAFLLERKRQLSCNPKKKNHSHGDAALALAQGNSQDSAALPGPSPSGALFPRVLTSSLPLPKGEWACGGAYTNPGPPGQGGVSLDGA